MTAKPGDRANRVPDPEPATGHARRVEAAAAVDHFKQAALAAYVGHKLVSPARPGVPQHVRAGLRDGEEQVADAALVDAEPSERIAEYPAHHRDAQRFPGEDQAELNVCGWFPRMEHPRSHPLLSPLR